jgi:hypothetical protein
MTDYRWSLEALAARYELHPKFNEVFVEGETDEGLLQWFFEQHGRDDVLVYPVTAIHIPEELITSRHLDASSRRSDVITLALELKGRLDNDVPVTCIADADTEHVLPVGLTSKYLLYTDYTSMEMYAFRPESVQKLLRIVAPSLSYSGVDVLSALAGMLVFLFAARAAARALGWGLSWISFERVAKTDGARIVFDDREFLERYLNTKGRRAQEAQFRAKMDELRARFREDPRFNIRGHDFIEALTWYLRKQSARSCRHLTSKVTHHVLFAELGLAELLKEQLFQSLLRRYPAPIRQS